MPFRDGCEKKQNKKETRKLGGVKTNALINAVRRFDASLRIADCESGSGIFVSGDDEPRQP